MASEIRRTEGLSARTWVAIVLTVAGALNWGFVGLFRFNLLAAIFGEASTVTRIVYVLVAIAGIHLLLAAGTRLRSVRPERVSGPGTRLLT
jgi:uncharacterized membrane protein YuzA (DUF378 family)